VAVTEALESPATVDEVFAVPQVLTPDVAALAGTRGVSIVRVSDSVLASLSDAATPQGIAAIVRTASWSIESLVADADLLVVLAAVGDPGNAGTLLRSALAAGASGAVFTRGSVDPWHPKTVRASAGALFRIPLVRAASFEDIVPALRASGLAVIGADAKSRRSLDSLDLTRRVALVLGNEAWGLPPKMHHLLDEEVGIPMPGPVESLNVGIAGSILLFEAVRQRRLSSATQ
jgi:RNA methyltransferase, TrmH family